MYVALHYVRDVSGFAHLVSDGAARPQCPEVRLQRGSVVASCPVDVAHLPVRPCLAGPVPELPEDAYNPLHGGQQPGQHLLRRVGEDTISSGGGDDFIYVDGDSYTDHVTCGSNLVINDHDTVYANSTDVVSSNCEEVHFLPEFQANAGQ